LTALKAILTLTKSSASVVHLETIGRRAATDRNRDRPQSRPIMLGPHRILDTLTAPKAPTPPYPVDAGIGSSLETVPRHNRLKVRHNSYGNRTASAIRRPQYRQFSLSWAVRIGYCQRYRALLGGAKSTGHGGDRALGLYSIGCRFGECRVQM